MGLTAYGSGVGENGDDGEETREFRDVLEGMPTVAIWADEIEGDVEWKRSAFAEIRGQIVRKEVRVGGVLVTSDTQAIINGLSAAIVMACCLANELGTEDEGERAHLDGNFLAIVAVGRERFLKGDVARILFDRREEQGYKG